MTKDEAFKRRWNIDACKAYAEQLRDKTRANTAEHAAEAIEFLLQVYQDQPPQEPVAWLCSPDENGLFELPTTHKACKDCFPVYTTPPQRKPLTDEELDLICEKALFCRISFQQFARSIEAAHGIKENT